VLGDQIIVDDDPARILVGRSSRADHLDPCGGVDHADLAPPVQSEAGHGLALEVGTLRRIHRRLSHPFLLQNDIANGAEVS
jgi:hypothetical protein